MAQRRHQAFIMTAVLALAASASAQTTATAGHKHKHYEAEPAAAQPGTGRPGRAPVAEPRHAHVPGDDEDRSRRSCSSTRA